MQNTLVASVDSKGRVVVYDKTDASVIVLDAKTEHDKEEVAKVMDEAREIFGKKVSSVSFMVPGEPGDNDLINL